MQFLMSTAALPMVAKPVYGIISDSVYIKGAHRVPYIIIAGEISSSAVPNFLVCGVAWLCSSISFRFNFWKCKGLQMLLPNNKYEWFRTIISLHFRVRKV